MTNLIVNKTYFFKAFCVVLLIVAAINLCASDIYKTTVGINLRSGAGSNYISLGLIKKGENLTVIDNSDSLWYKVEYNGKEGYVFSKYLSIVVKETQVVVQEKSDSGNGFFVFFCIVVLIVVVICMVKLNNRNSSNSYSNKSSPNKISQEFKRNLKITITSSNSYNDDSIIDVTNQSYRYNSDLHLIKYNAGVPYWAHQYVYSYSEINTATVEQKRFYYYFKNSFLNGTYYDLEGNTNYAFILLFNLLNEHENHKDTPSLEKHLHILGQYYPKTKSYGISFLIKIMEATGDSDGVSRIRVLDRYDYQNNYVDYDYWKLGSKYKTKLNLKDEDVLLLNKLWYSRNNFSGIEFCCLEILKLYIAVNTVLKRKYNQESSTLEEQFLSVSKVIATKQYNYREGSNNYKYCIESAPNEFYSTIFKICENIVREHYGHKRKINTEIYTSSEAKSEFDLRISSKVADILSGLVSSISPPDEATEIELNSQNTNRWKTKFEELTSSYKDNPKQFMDWIVSLGNLNKKNPSIENIFYEASKFISKYDKEIALKLYIHYLYYDLKSTTFDNKPLTKTIQKNLFKTNEQLHDFEILISKLINDKNLENALQEASKIYKTKRKKIQLDSETIKEVQHQHTDTVELLNEYLEDEYEDDRTTIKTRELNNEEVKIEITNKTDIVHNSNYKGVIVFTQIQTTVLDIFAKSNYSIAQSEIDSYAKSQGIFKNQLIESINELCFETLDDVLIEEEDEYYCHVTYNMT